MAQKGAKQSLLQLLFVGLHIVPRALKLYINMIRHFIAAAILNMYKI